MGQQGALPAIGKHFLLSGRFLTLTKRSLLRFSSRLALMSARGLRDWRPPRLGARFSGARFSGSALRHLLSRPVRAVRTLYPTGRKRLGCPPPPQFPGPGGPKQSSRSSSGLESWVCNVCIFFAGPGAVHPLFVAAHFSVVTGALANSRPRTIHTLPTPIIAHPADLPVSAPFPTANRTRSAPSSIALRLASRYSTSAAVDSRPKASLRGG